MEPILCKKHNVAKVPMRNKRNAPMLGCLECHGKAQEPAPAPAPTPSPEPATPPPAPKRKAGTLFTRWMEG